MAITYTCDRCNATSTDSEEISDKGMAFANEENKFWVLIQPAWNDQYSTSLCKNCRAALKDKTQELINDFFKDVKNETQL